MMVMMHKEDAQISVKTYKYRSNKLQDLDHSEYILGWNIVWKQALC